MAKRNERFLFWAHLRCAVLFELYPPLESFPARLCPKRVRGTGIVGGLERRLECRMAGRAGKRFEHVSALRTGQIVEVLPDFEHEVAHDPAPLDALLLRLRFRYIYFPILRAGIHAGQFHLPADSREEVPLLSLGRDLDAIPMPEHVKRTLQEQGFGRVGRAMPAGVAEKAGKI